MSTPSLREICEGEAFALFLASNAMTLAEEQNDPDMLEMAVEKNLDIWLKVKAHCMCGYTILSQSVRDNLIRLADFVCQETVMFRKGDRNGRPSTLATINLQIAEGMFQAVERAEIEEKEQNGDAVKSEEYAA